MDDYNLTSSLCVFTWHKDRRWGLVLAGEVKCRATARDTHAGPNLVGPKSHIITGPLVVVVVVVVECLATASGVQGTSKLALILVYDDQRPHIMGPKSSSETQRMQKIIS